MGGDIGDDGGLCLSVATPHKNNRFLLIILLMMNTLVFDCRYGAIAASPIDTTT